MKWSADESSRVETLWKQGMTTGEISKKIGRTRNSVVARLNRLGLLGSVPKTNYERRETTTRRKPMARKNADWDSWLFEPYAHRKIRLANEQEKSNVR